MSTGKKQRWGSTTQNLGIPSGFNARRGSTQVGQAYVDNEIEDEQAYTEFAIQTRINSLVTPGVGPTVVKRHIKVMTNKSSARKSSN